MTKSSTFPKGSFILVVESIPDEMFKISEALKGNDFRVIGAMDGESFARAMKRELPDFIVINVQLTAGNAYDIIHSLKGDDKTKHIKVIAIISAKCEGKAWAAGADDIIKQPVEPLIIVDSIKGFLRK